MTNPLTEQALQESRSFRMRRVPLLRPLAWLGAGWRDLWRCPLPGLLHGLATALFGSVLLWLAHDHFWLLSGAFSGFLLVGPLVATGLYAISRSLAQGGRPDLGTAIAAWKPDDRHLVAFGLLLAAAGTGWVLTSASLIITQAPTRVETPADFLHIVVLAPQGHLFELWLGLGALLAAPVFASSVVTIPLLMDRRVSLAAAVFTSWRVVMEDPLPMALWAALLLALCGLGMATAMLGLIVVVPWLAHASWHAYRDLVDATVIAERS
jgi:uncharacterized membrane protein